MKIAVYSHSIAPSIDGVCRRFTGIIWELVKQGHEILLFTLEQYPEDLPKNIQIATLDHMFFPNYPNKKIGRPNLKSLITIYTHLNQFRPEVIHVTADGMSQFFSYFGFLFNIPVVGSFHTDVLDLITNLNANAFQKFCVLSKERLDSIVFDSSATTSLSFLKKLELQGVHCEHVIHTAVNVDNFKPEKKSMALRSKLTFGNTDALLCTYVGRISIEKRIDVIVNALKGVEGVYLAIIGDGPTAAQYAALHGNNSRIYCVPRFLNHEELAEVYASSDIHVTASQFETLGNTVLESFACGTPVVAPNAQGFCDTVTHGRNGFLFAPGNAEEAKRYILKLKDDVELRREMGEHGRMTVQHHTLSRVVSDLVVWYGIGLMRRKALSVFKRVAFLALLSLTTPITVLCLSIYDAINHVLSWFKSFGNVKNVEL